MALIRAVGSLEGLVRWDKALGLQVPPDPHHQLARDAVHILKHLVHCGEVPLDLPDGVVFAEPETDMFLQG